MAPTPARQRKHTAAHAAKHAAKQAAARQRRAVQEAAGAAVRAARANARGTFTNMISLNEVPKRLGVELNKKMYDPRELQKMMAHSGEGSDYRVPHTRRHMTAAERNVVGRAANIARGHEGWQPAHTMFVKNLNTGPIDDELASDLVTGLAYFQTAFHQWKNYAFPDEVAADLTARVRAHPPPPGIVVSLVVHEAEDYDEFKITGREASWANVLAYHRGRRQAGGRVVEELHVTGTRPRKHTIELISTGEDPELHFRDAAVNIDYESAAWSIEAKSKSTAAQRLASIKRFVGSYRIAAGRVHYAPMRQVRLRYAATPEELAFVKSVWPTATVARR